MGFETIATMGICGEIVTVVVGDLFEPVVIVAVVAQGSDGL